MYSGKLLVWKDDAAKQLFLGSLIDYNASTQVCDIHRYGSNDAPTTDISMLAFYPSWISRISQKYTHDANAPLHSDPDEHTILEHDIVAQDFTLTSTNRLPTSVLNQLSSDYKGYSFPRPYQGNAALNLLFETSEPSSLVNATTHQSIDYK